MRWILGATLTIAACTPAATPTATPHAPTPTGAPCFIDRPALPGVALFDELSTGDTGGARRLGSCTIAGSVLRDADGAAIATVDCALTTTVPGIVDDVGLGVGARGDLVLARNPGPVDRFACLPENSVGDDADRSQLWTRCWMAVDDDGDRRFEYLVAGAPPPVPEGEILRGEPARAFFAARTVIAFRVLGDCH
jgi:hypothetical protein